MESKANNTIQDFNVRIRQQSDGETLWWTAQCVEYGICAQAEKLEDLGYEFTRMAAGRLAAAKELGVEPFKGKESLDLTALHGAIKAALTDVFGLMGSKIQDLDWFSSQASNPARSKSEAKRLKIQRPNPEETNKT